MKYNHPRLTTGAVGLLLLASLTACSNPLTTHPSQADPTAAPVSASPSTAPSASKVSGSESTATSPTPIEKVSVPATMKDTLGEANTSTLGKSGASIAQRLNSFTVIQNPGFNRSLVKHMFDSEVAPAMTPEVADELWQDIADKDGSNLMPMTTQDSYEVDGAKYSATDEPWQFQYGEPVVEEVSKPGHAIPGVQYAYRVRNLVPVKDGEGAQKFISYEVTRAYTLQPGPDDATPWLVNRIEVSDRENVQVVDAGEVK